jgi:alpha-ketoglutarate-dependent taurine dioxygenase
MNLISQAPIPSPSLSPSPPSEWNAFSLLKARGWRMNLPASAVDEFLEYLQRHPDFSQHPDAYRLLPDELPIQSELGQRIREELLFGFGVCWIQGLANQGLSELQQRLFYLSLGMSTGDLMTQYGRLYSIRDRGLDHTRQAVPVSMTSAATGLHTDSSSVDACPDFVALLCERPSSNGGESLLSNALTAYRKLQATAPWTLRILQSDFIRDVVTPGRSRTHADLLRNRFPIFGGTPENAEPHFRYMRYWIEKGHDRTCMPLGDSEVAALDLLDGILESRQNLVRIRLRRGDMLLMNNRILAHARSSYEDSPSECRQLQRLWLQAPNRVGNP